MEFDDTIIHRDNLVLYSKLSEEKPQVDHEGFTMGLSSSHNLDHIIMQDGSSSYPFPTFRCPFYDPFQTCFGKLNPDDYSTLQSFAEDATPPKSGHMSTRVPDLIGSKSSFQRVDPREINETKTVDTNNSKRKRNDSKKKEPVQTRRKKIVGKKSDIIKGQWTADEDRLLEKLVEQHGVRKWSCIAQMLPGRIGKQCRERWHNHLKPNIKKDRWSEEEDRILIEAHRQVGNRWAEIARCLPGRSENTIKNHWNATKRRQLSSRRNKNTISPLQNYIKKVISGNVTSDHDDQYYLDNSSSSSGSISPIKKTIIDNCGDVTAENHHDYVEAHECFLDPQIDFQKEMDFMEMLSIGYI